MFRMELNPKFPFDQNPHAGDCPEVRFESKIHRGFQKKGNQLHNLLLFQLGTRSWRFCRFQDGQTSQPIFPYLSKNSGTVQPHPRSNVFDQDALLDQPHGNHTRLLLRLVTDGITLLSKFVHALSIACWESIVYLIMLPTIVLYRSFRVLPFVWPTSYQLAAL